MKKRCIYTNFILLLWFFLDMIGIYFENCYLVSRAWKEDGIFFLIYLLAFLLFIFYDKVGKYILSIWLTIWLIAQFFAHEYLTIVGGGENKSKYFKDSIKIFTSQDRYYPDLYHTILHMLIFFSLFFTLSFILNQKTSNNIKSKH